LVTVAGMVLPPRLQGLLLERDLIAAWLKKHTRLRRSA